MILGFAGTRRGMTEAQRSSVEGIVRSLNPSEIWHGACRGADLEIDRLAVALAIPRQAFPGPGQRLDRPWGSVIVHPEEDYLRRNRRIVDGASVMLACPGEMAEQSRGGTWYTIRYARKRSGLLLHIVYPDGTRECHFVAGGS